MSSKTCFDYERAQGQPQQFNEALTQNKKVIQRAGWGVWLSGGEPAEHV